MAVLNYPIMILQFSSLRLELSNGIPGCSIRFYFNYFLLYINSPDFDWSPSAKTFDNFAKSYNRAKISLLPNFEPAPFIPG